MEAAPWATRLCAAEMFMPSAVKEFESPPVSAERKEQTLHTLLAVQNHVKSGGRVLHADRLPVTFASSVNYSPKGPR